MFQDFFISKNSNSSNKRKKGRLGKRPYDGIEFLLHEKLRKFKANFPCTQIKEKKEKHVEELLTFMLQREKKKQASGSFAGLSLNQGLLATAAILFMGFLFTLIQVDLGSLSYDIAESSSKTKENTRISSGKRQISEAPQPLLVHSINSVGKVKSKTERNAILRKGLYPVTIKTAQFAEKTEGDQKRKGQTGHPRPFQDDLTLWPVFYKGKDFLIMQKLPTQKFSKFQLERGKGYTMLRPTFASFNH